MDWQSIETAPKDEWIVVYCSWVKEVAFAKFRTKLQARGRVKLGWQVKFNSGIITYINGEPSFWLPISPPGSGPGSGC